MDILSHPQFLQARCRPLLTVLAQLSTAAVTGRQTELLHAYAHFWLLNLLESPPPCRVVFSNGCEATKILTVHPEHCSRGQPCLQALIELMLIQHFSIVYCVKIIYFGLYRLVLLGQTKVVCSFCVMLCALFNAVSIIFSPKNIATRVVCALSYFVAFKLIYFHFVSTLVFYLLQLVSGNYMQSRYHIFMEYSCLTAIAFASYL